MNTPHLNQHHIETADLSHFYAVAEGQLFMVYAPLAGLCFLADAEEVARLEHHIALPSHPDAADLAPLLAQLTDESGARWEDSVVRHPREFTKLSVLPNLMCNFSCAYCYSAQGRSHMEVSEEHVKTMLDFFIDSKRVQTPILTIFISGGGEPVLSWHRVQHLIDYAEQRALEQHFKLELLLMTNGSLLTPSIATFLREHRVQVGVSFDILPDVQKRQRGKFEQVSQAVRMLMAEGVCPSISAVITPLNVGRMTEMAQTIISDYQGVKHLNFDPAMSNELFPTARALDAFYAQFYEQFFVAKRLCGEHHITLDCNIIRKAEKLFPRYCQGKLCLTPEGRISMCHTVSSPREPAYEEVTYGLVDSGRVVFDEARFSSFVSPQAYLMPACEACIARWHCAGGCMMYRRHYDSDKMESVCRFTQRMIGTILLGKLNAEYHRHHGHGIEELILSFQKPQ